MAYWHQVYNYSEAEQLVREVTCNDAREPSVMLMKEIAKSTFTVDFSAVMAIVWKRIKDKSTGAFAHPTPCWWFCGLTFRRRACATLAGEHYRASLSPAVCVSVGAHRRLQRDHP